MRLLERLVPSLGVPISAKFKKTRGLSFCTMYSDRLNIGQLMRFVRIGSDQKPRLKFRNSQIRTGS
jgi:hypothetical protein